MGLEDKDKPYSTFDLHKAQTSIDGSPAGGRDAHDYSGELEILFEDFRGKKILDLGAGSDIGLARGLQELGIQCEVHSFSPAFAEPGPAQEAVGFVQDNASRLVVAGMGEALPYKDDTFDMVVSFHMFEHLSSRTQVIKIINEVVRVLKPGGEAQIGPLPAQRPQGYDPDGRFLVTKSFIENSCDERPNFTFEWKMNKPPWAMLIVSDGTMKYPTQSCVLVIKKNP